MNIVKVCWQSKWQAAFDTEHINKKFPDDSFLFAKYPILQHIIQFCDHS